MVSRASQPLRRMIGHCFAEGGRGRSTFHAEGGDEHGQRQADRRAFGPSGYAHGRNEVIGDVTTAAIIDLALHRRLCARRENAADRYAGQLRAARASSSTICALKPTSVIGRGRLVIASAAPSVGISHFDDYRAATTTGLPNHQYRIETITAGAEVSGGRMRKRGRHRRIAADESSVTPRRINHENLVEPPMMNEAAARPGECRKWSDDPAQLVRSAALAIPGRPAQDASSAADADKYDGEDAAEAHKSPSMK